MEVQLVLDILKRRKRMVGLIFLAVLVTLFLSVLVVEDRYTVSARVLIRSSSATSVLMSSLGLSTMNVSSTIDDTERENYISLFTAGPILSRVIEKLDLQRKRKLAQLIDMVPLLNKIIRLKRKVKTVSKEELASKSMLQFYFPRPYIEISQFGDSDLLKIDSTSTDINEAVQMANAFAEVYIEEEKKMIKRDYANAKKVIVLNQQQAKDEYNQALLSMRDFKVKEKYIDLETERGLLLTQVYTIKSEQETNGVDIVNVNAQIENFNKQLSQAPKYVKGQVSFSSSSYISTLKTSLQELYVDLASYKASYTTNNPNVKTTQLKIDELKRLIKEEIGKNFSSETYSFGALYETLTDNLAEAYSNLAGYESKEKAYDELIRQYESQLLELPEKTSRFEQVSVQVEAAQDVYLSVMTYKYRIELAEAIALSKVYLVEPATVPVDIGRVRSPRTGLVLAIAIFLGLSAGVGAALVAEYLNPYSSSRQAENEDTTAKSSDETTTRV